MIDYCIVGLGNPGNKYINTRHNVGFLALDQIKHEFGFSDFKKETKFQSYISGINCFNNKKLLLIKPTTYMNQSGTALRTIANFYKIRPEQFIIIHDDLDLALGQLKYKFSGGNAGHNGLKSIDMFLSTNYHRIRIGIDKPKTDISNYVLGCFDKSEYLVITQSFSQVIEIITKLLQ